MRRHTKIKKRTKKYRYSTRKIKGGSTDLISVIIPTYNRFKYLLATIESIKAQTYKNIEIIVVNDKSTQPEYYSYDFGKNVNVIHLEKNSREIHNFPCAGHVRNEGIKAAKGRFIAFCDDDDSWMPNKLNLQMESMKVSGCKMSCTEGFIGEGEYNHNKRYKKYNSEHFMEELKKIFKNKGSDALDKGFPKVWKSDFLEIHNCAITSSVVISKEILDKIGNFNIIHTGEDYDCWKRALKYTDMIYIEEPCFYYDNYHGDGRQYGGSIDYIIYTLWTGTNEMSENRKESLESLKKDTECNVVLITPDNLAKYIKDEHPLHEAYQYLSETHKADYLRTYLMNFYGGGYSDIKKPTGSWKSSFDTLAKSDKWICGYAEPGPGGIAYAPVKDNWQELIGNGAYICKPNTPLTNEWYNDMIKILDTKIESLKLHPAKFPRNGFNEGGPNSKYPIIWNEILGQIFHRLIYKYKDHVLNSLPILNFTDYRGGKKNNSKYKKSKRVHSRGMVTTRRLRGGSKPVKIFNMCLHMSVIEDVKNVLSLLYGSNIQITNWKMNDHGEKIKELNNTPPADIKHITINTWENIDMDMIKRFQDEYDSVLSTFDAFIVTHTPVFAMIFEKYGKPIIVVNSCRYDQPFCRNKNMDMLQKFNDALKRMEATKQLILISNNLADQEYLKERTGLNSVYIPCLCQYTNVKYNPKNPSYIIFENKVKDTFPTSDKIVSKPSNYKFLELFEYSGIIHMPYDISSMALFEQYFAGMPLFFPTKEFYKKCIKDGIIEFIVRYDKPGEILPDEELEKWLKNADYYNFKYINYYSSFEDCVSKVEAFKDTDKDARLQHIEGVKKDSLDKWKKIFDEYVMNK